MRWLLIAACLLSLFALGPVYPRRTVVGGGTAPTLEGCNSAEGSGTAFNIGTSGLSIADGDLLVFFMGVDPNSLQDGTTPDPTGGNGSNAWTRVFLQDSTSNALPMLGAWWKEADTEGTDPTYRIDYDPSGDGSGVVCKVTGHNSTQLDGSGSDSGTSSTPTAPAVSGVTTDSLALYWVAYDGGNETMTCPTALPSPGNCTIIDGDGGSGDTNTGIAWDDTTSTTAAAATFVISTGSDGWRAATLVIDAE